MSKTYYKAVRPDGTDWYTGSLRWIPEDGIIPEGGWLVKHPAPGPVGDGDAAGYLSVATAPTDCTGMVWPSRLLRVEPAGEVWTPSPEQLPHKRAAHAWRIVEELDPHLALGPRGVEVAALIDEIKTLSPAAWEAARAAAWEAARDASRAAAWEAARKAAWEAARDASRAAARDASRDAAWDAARAASREAAWDASRKAAREAAGAAVVRDLISPDHYAILMAPIEAARAVMSTGSHS